jgi:hypothetical protein
MNMRAKICYLVSTSAEDKEEIDDGIVKRVVEEKTETHHKTTSDNIKDESYYHYISHYGHHFNEKLARYAVEKLNSLNPKICYEKVEEILKQSDEELDDSNTTADLYYVANEMKARHSSNTVKSDAHIVMLAIEYLNDPNKLEGEIFCEWLDRLKRKDKKITWNSFV